MLDNFKDDIKAHMGNVGSQVVEQVIDHDRGIPVSNKKLDKVNAKSDKMETKINRLISLVVVVLLFVVIVRGVFLVFPLWDQSSMDDQPQEEPATTVWNLVEKIGSLYKHFWGNLMEKIGDLYTRVGGNLR